MKPRIQLAVLCALLALAAGFPDISVDQVNPPPSIIFTDSHRSVQDGEAKTKASIPDVKDVKEPGKKADVKLEAASEVVKEVTKPAEEKLPELPKAPSPETLPEPVMAVQADNQNPVAPVEKEAKPAENNEKPLGLKKKTARSGSISLEDQEIEGYVPFKAANAGMRLPPNQMRPLRQQPYAQPAYGQYPYNMAAQGNRERADKRKRPAENKNKKKPSNKKRRQSSSSNRKKKDKKKVSKPAPSKKPVNKNRRGTPANNNNHLNANYNNHNYEHNNNNHHHAQQNNVQKNKRKATPAPVAHGNKNKQKQQPHRHNPNNRRKLTTKRPAARRRKQTYKGRPYYNEQAY